jgi:hypothetical protein
MDFVLIFIDLEFLKRCPLIRGVGNMSFEIGKCPLRQEFIPFGRTLLNLAFKKFFI